MRDKVSITRASLLHPLIREDIMQAIDNAESGLPPNIAIRIVQGYRTFDEQNGLYNLGRTKVNPDGKTAKKPMGNIVTNAKAGSSFHNYGLAIDFAILIDGKTISWDTTKDRDMDKIADWQEVVKAFTNQGFEWGGAWRTFTDLPHIQQAFGFTWRQLLEKHNKKDFITGTTYVNISVPAQ